MPFQSILAALRPYLCLVLKGHINTFEPRNLVGTISVRLKFSRGGGRKFAKLQRNANIYEFAGDTDLGHRDIYKYNFFLVRHALLV